MLGLPRPLGEEAWLWPVPAAGLFWLIFSVRQMSGSAKALVPDRPGIVFRLALDLTSYVYVVMLDHFSHV